MRLRLGLLSLALFSSVGQTLAAPEPGVIGTPVEVAPRADADPAEGSVYNGQHVPPIAALSGTTWKADTSKGYWLIKAFSPYCPHCTSLQPKWQTIYEYYFTSNPLSTTSEPDDPFPAFDSFTNYYDLQWASLDCVAFGTACVEMGVQTFPLMVLLKDGEEVKRLLGDRTMKELADFIEASLEMIRPGSRPAEGIVLPQVGDHGDPTLASLVSNSDVLRDGVPAAADLISVPGVKASKTNVTPNQRGAAVPLTAETFQKHVTKTLDPWFVEFYAPWCPHCQALAPIWAAMARDMKGRLNVGKVDCTTESRLCRDVHVSRYPTIAFFQGPMHVQYEGLRGLGDLISWGGKAVEASRGVPEVNATEFEALEATEDVIFLYVHDHATTSEDMTALERLPLNLVGHAKLVKTSDDALVQRFKVTTWPRLLVSREGHQTVYAGVTPRDFRDVDRLTGWVRANWHPLVPELTATNARELMSGRYVVLGVLSRERADEFAIAKREIKNAALEWMDKEVQAFKLERQELRDAKQLRIEEAEDRNDQRALRNAKLIRINMDDIPHKEVVFAWVDGVFWERWIKTTFGLSVRDGEKVIINDEDNRRYWDVTITGNPIVPSRTSILETLPKVVRQPPSLTAKTTGSSLAAAFFRARTAATLHPVRSALLAFAACVALVYAVRAARARSSARRGAAAAAGRVKLPISVAEANALSSANGGQKGD